MKFNSIIIELSHYATGIEGAKKEKEAVMRRGVLY